MLRRLSLFVAGSLLLAGCAAEPPAPVVPMLPDPLSAAEAGLRAGPPVSSLGLTPANAARGVAGFRESCPALLARGDQSGLTAPADWAMACEAAKVSGKAEAFFERYFETATVGTGGGFVTGYYEPQIAGVRERRPGFDIPIYGVPADLVRQHDYAGAGRAPLGRYDADGAFKPYFDRAAIEDGALASSAPIIAWAADPIDFFFLQIQGSGQLIAPDGTVTRIGYAAQNGREYVAIGRVLRERGVFASGEVTMQKIVEWLRVNPDEGRALMRENKSWVFFRILDGDAPLGAMGVPVRAQTSVAADPRFVPLGAPVWIDASTDSADGLWIAQDTGGAIKGANRFDTFWGAGRQGEAIAGAMSSDAQTLILLPKGTLARLNAR